MIKYKGQTSLILKDLSLALYGPVQLKAAEDVLYTFFSSVIQKLDTEKRITLLTQLPPSFKAFCTFVPQNTSPQQSPEVIRAVFGVLDRYIPTPQLMQVYSCFPENLFICQSGVPKDKFLQATVKIR